MKLKNKLILLGILIGVISCFAISSLQAVEITSVFNGETITRKSVENLSTVSEIDTSIVPVILGISKSEYKTNNGNFYWAIKDSSNQYKDIYCLNLERGFGQPNGIITNENSTKNYTNQYDLNSISDENYIAYTGLDTANKDKILWILNNSLTSIEDLTTILTAASQKVEISSIGLTNKDIENFIKEDMKSNTRNSTKLTFDDVKIIQQIAIWHYTNSNSVFDNTIQAICNSEGKQISQLMEENIDTDGYGMFIWNGKVKQAKLNALYKYFIDGAESATSETNVPTLTLSNTNAKVAESEEHYVVGPFSLNGTNTQLIKSITANVNVDYTLLNSLQVEVANNDFSKVIGSEFYLKIAKSKITQDTNITINLTYKYDKRELKFLTNINDVTNTQPVVLVEAEEQDPSISTNATIIAEKITKTVIKKWNDQEDRDGIRPDSVVVKLYKTINGEKTEVDSQRLDETNNWMYVWNELNKRENGVDIVYSVEENSVEEYTTTYSAKDYSNTDEITITNTYVPIKITGKYNVVLRKVDQNGNILTGSKFKLNGTEYNLSTGETTICENQQITTEEEINFTYIIEETLIPEGYKGIEKTEVNIKAQVQKINNNYRLIRATLVDGEENNITNEAISIKLEGNSIVIVVKNIPIEKQFDLALRKFITKINDEIYSREPIVDTSTIATTGTATYKHSKQPIAVQKGDIVTYTIRVYNEGEIDGYVDKITDYLPDNLLPIITGVEGINEEKYAEEIGFNLDWGWINLDDGKTITTMKTAKTNSEIYSLIKGYENVTDTKLNAYVEGSNELDYIDVQIKCLVTDSAIGGEYLTNIAEITESQDINGIKGDGVDSKLANADYSNLSDYKNEEAIKSTTSSYIAGQEDDDDFEKLVVKEFDLSLRKFITKVNETTHSREPQVDTSKLGTIVNGKTITTATYVHTKEPVIVETGDLVTYTIRIYNEGTIAGYANEITDDIPEGLEFLPNSDINISYRWKMLDKEGNETEDVTKAVIITTDYLSNINPNNIIKEVTEVEGTKTLSYKDVEVQFKVIAKAEKLQDNIIINEAQISADSDRDIDSDPNRDEKYDYDLGNNEDDIDYEPIKLQYFDLALRKFITKVNSTDYNNRYPEVNFKEDGNISYNHTKDPVLVATGDTVIYTIRVYNEGKKAGYATEIKDNLPEGLAFDPQNETNKLYGWKMIDKEGNVTEEVEKVVAFKTNYLENEKIDSLVEVNGSKVLSYKDVQIAFIVTESNTSDKILVNTAQISADSDEDIDSIPDNSVESEDDIDKEYVKVQYFDLALKKWVTETRVTLDGKTTTTKTEFDEDSDGIAKVDIVAKKLKKTTVKFVYNIKVTNEGELPGYANEIKDYIPNGLKFVAEDNKNWKEVKGNVVVTDQLKDTILNPGESATVEIVLTWKNSSTNLGVKTNYAEISVDSAEDIDSIPDNYDFTEDDIDDAKVILSIKTAGANTYIGLVLISVAVLAGGIFLIKRYVLD